MNKIINNVLEGNLEAFIIPNKGGLVTNWLSESTQQRMINDIKKISILSSKEFDPKNDPVVQLWFTGMGCENLVDHYLHAETDDSKRVYMRARNLGHLPASFFEGKKEGDSIDLVFPATCEVADSDDELNITVKAKVTLAQTKYRYRSFGNFEDVLRQVI